MMKKLFPLLTLVFTAVLLVACGNSTEDASAGDSSTEEQIIHLATSPGPYSELFLNEVAPILEEKGYTIETTEFSQVRPANISMIEGETNLNVEQNDLYVDNFNNESGADLETIAPLPTLASALYPANKSTLDEVEEGDQVGVPVDPANLTRALLILEKIGWITLDSNVEPLGVSPDSIVENHAGIEIVPMESASIPPALADLDYAVIPGAVVYDAGIAFDSALAREDVKPELFLQVLVRSEDAGKQWIQDVVDAYQSDEFLSAVEEINQNPEQPNWILPENS